MSAVDTRRVGYGGKTAAVAVAMGIVLGLAGPAHAAPATGTVAGTYTTDDGTPIAGANVYTTSPEYNGWSMSGTTDARGRYLLRDVPAGPFTLQLRTNGITQYAPRTLD